MGHPYWPLYDLVVRTPRLELRYIDDALGVELAALAAGGVHDPGWMPFAVPWTDVASPELERNSLRYWWGLRADTTPEHWELALAVVVDGCPVGITSIGADSFPRLRAFQTGSWLGRAHQGRGIGTEMRAATLHLGFAGFDGAVAATTAFADNAPSLGVTRRLGYEPNGTTLALRRDEPAPQVHFRLTREAWAPQRRDDIELAGIDGARELLGLG